MAHLGSFRRGWEAENLARYILYKFAFIAHPSNVADDIGSDFFCTLFQRKKEGRQEYLVPRHSFAIQIKSDNEDLDVSNKVEYIANLELPFFVGKADRENLKLTMYSGEFIPAFFSFKGIPKRLRIQPCESHSDDYLIEHADGNYTVRFPKVAEIAANADSTQLDETVKHLIAICSIMHQNISSRKNLEPMYQMPSTGHTLIFAGAGSAQVFRDNFLKRLTEVYHNLLWIYKNDASDLNRKEYELYERLYYELKDYYSTSLPQLLNTVFRQLQLKVNPLAEGDMIIRDIE